MNATISYDMENEAYHKAYGLSSTFLRNLVTLTPSQAQYKRLHPEGPSEAMKLGTLIHTLVLEPDTFDDRYAVMPQGLTKAQKDGKAFAKEAEALGKEVITHDKYADLGYLLNRLENCPDYQVVRHMKSRGKPEASIIWKEWIGGEMLTFKTRPDWLWEEEGFLFDLKTSSNAGATGYGCFPSKAQALAYPMQAYMACRGYEALTGKKAKGHIWIVIDSSPPYDVARYDMDEQAYWAGETLFNKAIALYQECKRNNHWPGHHTGNTPLPLSSYYLNTIGDLTYDH